MFGNGNVVGYASVNFNGMTEALQRLLAAIAAGAGPVQEASHHLLWALVTIEIVLIGLGLGFEQEHLFSVLKKFLGLGIWIWLAQNFTDFGKLLVESLASAGLAAGGKGGSFAILQDPSTIAVKALTLTAPFLTAISDLPMSAVADKLIYYGCYIALMCAYFLMAVYIFYAMVEYKMYLVLAAAIFPFSVNQHLRFIGDKGVNMVLATGLKLMVLGFILSIIEPTLALIKFSNATHIQWNELWSIMFTVGALTYLTVKAPAAAAGMVHGLPTLTGSAFAFGAFSAAAYLGAGAAKPVAKGIGWAGGGVVKGTWSGVKAGGRAIAAASRLPSRRSRSSSGG